MGEPGRATGKGGAGKGVGRCWAAGDGTRRAAAKTAGHVESTTPSTSTSSPVKQFTTDVRLLSRVSRAAPS